METIALNIYTIRSQLSVLHDVQVKTDQELKALMQLTGSEAEFIRCEDQSDAGFTRCNPTHIITQ